MQKPKVDPTCAKCANTCKYYEGDGVVVQCPNFKKILEKKSK